MNQNAELEMVVEEDSGNSWRSRKSLKVLAMYCSMVTVSTLVIFSWNTPRSLTRFELSW